jgi:hypothetical protein
MPDFVHGLRTGASRDFTFILKALLVILLHGLRTDVIYEKLAFRAGTFALVCVDCARMPDSVHGLRTHMMSYKKSVSRDCSFSVQRMPDCR